MFALLGYKIKTGEKRVVEDERSDLHMKITTGGETHEFKMKFVTLHRPCEDCGANVELFGVVGEIDKESPTCKDCEWVYRRMWQKEW